MKQSTFPKLALCASILVVCPFLCSAGDFQSGIEMFAKACRGVCWVENQYKSRSMDDQWVKQLDSCYLNLNFKEDEWQSRYDYHSDFQKQYESDPEKVRTVAEMYALKYLKVDLKNFYLIKLPSAYKSICEEFIDNENQEPAKDYSTILQDSLNGDYPFRGLAHCLIGAIEENHKADDLVALNSYWLNPEAFMQAVQYGIDMFAKSGRGVCWIEKLNKLQPIDELGVPFRSCEFNMRFKDNEWQSQYDNSSDYYKQHYYNTDTIREITVESTMKYLKTLMKTNYFTQLPPIYKTACEEFVDDENQKPAKDYYAILQDSSKGDYPFRGLAHCLMGAIEENNKADDFVALNSYWLKPKPFLEAFIDRENKNRARHGVPMLTLDTELSLRAQRYADEIARICDIVHMIDNPKYGADHPDHQYNGGWTGENLGKTATTYLTDSDNGVDVANTFYSEIKDYPWPEYTGNNADYLKIGHFTQSVWKSTTLAGYGITRNESCPVFKVYIVARYFPAGNRMTYYKDNVLPPIY